MHLDHERADVEQADGRARRGLRVSERARPLAARADGERLDTVHRAAFVAVQVAAEDRSRASRARDREQCSAGVQWAMAYEEAHRRSRLAQRRAGELDGGRVVGLIAEDDDLDRPVAHREAAALGMSNALRIAPGPGQKLS